MKIMLFGNISTFLYETFANGKKCIFLDCWQKISKNFANQKFFVFSKMLGVFLNNNKIYIFHQFLIFTWSNCMKFHYKVIQNQNYKSNSLDESPKSRNPRIKKNSKPIQMVEEKKIKKKVHGLFIHKKVDLLVFIKMAWLICANWCFKLFFGSRQTFGWSDTPWFTLLDQFYSLLG